MLKSRISFLFLLICNTLLSQNDIEFVKEKIEQAYLPLNPSFDSLKLKAYKTDAAGYPNDTLWMLSEITVPYADQHMIIYELGCNRLSDSEGNPQHLSLTAIANKINNAKNSGDKIAGYWMNDIGTCLLGIAPSSADKDIYEGFVYAYTDTAWTGNMVLRFSLKNRKHRTCEFVRMSSKPYRQVAPFIFSTMNEIQIWSYSRWNKLAWKDAGDKGKNVKPFNYKASFTEIDSATAILKIPSNSGSNRAVIDSLLDSNKEMLEKAKLLIIDLRNNAGGEVRTFPKLASYVQTGLVQRGEAYIYVSEPLIEFEKKNLSKIDSATAPARYRDQKKYVDSLLKIKGQKIMMPAKPRPVDSIKANPLKVAVLINYACMSGAELMIWDMMQSEKVTTFGERTSGATAHVNFFSTSTPSGKYELWLPSLKVIPSAINKYAGKGIPPHIFIPGSEKDWIKYVKKYFEKL